jgi:hypothetical protein
MLIRAATVLAFAVLLAACGGPIKNDELERGVLSLSSTAAAGSLLTDGVIDDSTKTTFVRVSARDLAAEASHEAEKLHDAHAATDMVDRKREAVGIAHEIADALLDLQVAPTDPHVAEAVKRRLDDLSKRADALALRI